jgi:hypothetical protein
MPDKTAITRTDVTALFVLVEALLVCMAIVKFGTVLPIPAHKLAPASIAVAILYFPAMIVVSKKRRSK